MGGGGGGGPGGRVGLGGQGGCERRIEVFVKIQKKMGGGGWSGGRGRVGGGQGGCDRRIEVFGKIHKKNCGGGVGGGGGCENSKKKIYIFFFFFGGGGSGWGVSGLIRALTRILKIGVKMASSRNSLSFSIHLYWDFSKSWSQIQKVGVNYSKFGVNETSG